MKNILRFLVVMLCLFTTISVIHAQNPEWINYTYGEEITSIAIQGDNIWIGTKRGLVKLNKTTGEKIFFNRGNSGLPDAFITSIAIDSSGNKWIGTLVSGLAKFDGTNWTVHNSNSGLPNYHVQEIVIHHSENKWIGTGDDGLVVYNEKGIVSVQKLKQRN